MGRADEEPSLRDDLPHTGRRVPTHLERKLQVIQSITGEHFTKFKFGTCEKSMVEMISGALRAGWFQPQVQDYLDMLPNLKAGMIVGVLKTKGCIVVGVYFLVVFSCLLLSRK